jgi:hypothetical protein
MNAKQKKLVADCKKLVKRVPNTRVEAVLQALIKLLLKKIAATK